MSGKRIFPGNLVVNKEIHTDEGVDKININNTLNNSSGTASRLVYGDATSSPGHSFNTSGNILYTPNINRLSVHTPNAGHAQSAGHASVSTYANEGQSATYAIATVQQGGAAYSSTNCTYAYAVSNAQYASDPNRTYNEHYVSQTWQASGDWIVRLAPYTSLTCKTLVGQLEGAGSKYYSQVDIAFTDAKMNLPAMQLANGYFNPAFGDPEHDWWQKYLILQAYIGQQPPYDSQQFTLTAKFSWKARSYSVTSDYRIKKNFEELDDLECLEILRKLKPCKYLYKSKIHGANVGQGQIGFIAQEVKEVLPDAVSLTRRVIPNIQIFADVMYITTNNTYKIILDEYPPPGTTILENDVLEIYTSKSRRNKKMDVEVTTVENKKIFYVKDLDESNFFNEITENSKVFVYGTYIDDFHVLQKDKIWAVGTAAFQQIDREHQIEKQKTTDLETKYVNLNKEISDLETQINTIISRIESLS